MPAGKLAAELGPVTVTLTILDQTGSAYQVAAGTLVADGRPHLLVASLGGEQARYPLRVAAITATFLLPLQPPGHGAHLERPVAGRLDGRRQLARSGRPAGKSEPAGASRAAAHASAARHETGGDVHFRPGYGYTVAGDQHRAPADEQIPGQLALLPPAAPVAAIPAIATRAFMDANSMAIGSVVPAFLDGVQSRCESWPR